MTVSDDELVYSWHDMWRECVDFRDRPGYQVHVVEEAKTLFVVWDRTTDARDLRLRMRPDGSWVFEKMVRFVGGYTTSRGNLTSIQAMLDLFDWLRGDA